MSRRNYTRVCSFEFSYVQSLPGNSSEPIVGGRVVGGSKTGGEEGGSFPTKDGLCCTAILIPHNTAAVIL